MTDDTRDGRLAKSSQFRQFGTRNLVVVQANGVKNIKPIDVANNGWTSCGHSKNGNNSLKMRKTSSSYVKSMGFDKLLLAPHFRANGKG
jgi:hypothetical protein